MQTLHEITQKYKYVRMVKPEDNDELLSFLEGIAMDCGPIAMKYCRRPNIIKSFQEQSSEAYIFVYLNEDETIGGFGSLLVNELFVNGQKVKAGYYADMRLSPTLTRKAHLQSRQIYAETLANYKEIEELKDIKYFYTAILKDNQKAINALTKKKRGIHYHELCEYNVTTLLKITRSLKRPRFTVKVETQLNSTLLNRHKRFLQRTKNDHKVITLSDKDKVIFSASIKKMKTRNLIITRAPKYLEFFCKILPIFRRPSLKLNKEFVQKYITDIYFYDSKYSEDDIFCEFLQYIRRLPDYKETHAFSFIQQHEALHKKSLGKCITHKTTGLLFQVTSDKEEQSIFPTTKTEIGFDICIS